MPLHKLISNGVAALVLGLAIITAMVWLAKRTPATYPLGISQDWLPPPKRDPAFDVDKP